MITLDLPIQTEQMIIEYAKKKGISVQQLILSKLEESIRFPKVHSDWQDFVALQNQLYQDHSEEFDNFELVRDLRLPQVRD